MVRDAEDIFSMLREFGLEVTLNPCKSITITNGEFVYYLPIVETKSEYSKTWIVVDSRTGARIVHDYQGHRYPIIAQLSECVPELGLGRYIEAAERFNDGLCTALGVETRQCDLTFNVAKNHYIELYVDLTPKVGEFLVEIRDRSKHKIIVTDPMQVVEYLDQTDAIFRATRHLTPLMEFSPDPQYNLESGYWFPARFNGIKISGMVYRKKNRIKELTTKPKSSGLFLLTAFAPSRDNELRIVCDGELWGEVIEDLIIPSNTILGSNHKLIINHAISAYVKGLIKE